LSFNKLVIVVSQTWISHRYGNPKQKTK